VGHGDLSLAATQRGANHAGYRNLRSVILGLLRQRFVFSTGDDDARELSNMLQTVYADVTRDDQPARARARITPDALMHLPTPPL
jgi:hypothetical protein